MSQYTRLVNSLVRDCDVIIVATLRYMPDCTGLKELYTWLELQSPSMRDATKSLLRGKLIDVLKTAPLNYAPRVAEIMGRDFFKPSCNYRFPEDSTRKFEDSDFCKLRELWFKEFC